MCYGQKINMLLCTLVLFQYEWNILVINWVRDHAQDEGNTKILRECAMIKLTSIPGDSYI